MTYGRYENSKREPSYQSVYFIAKTFNCNIDFLYGLSDEMAADTITISRSESPELYSLILDIQNDKNQLKRLKAYANALKKTD